MVQKAVVIPIVAAVSIATLVTLLPFISGYFHPNTGIENAGQGPVVAYGFLAEILYELSDGKIVPYLLTSRSADPHELELTPAQLESLGRSEYLLAIDREIDVWASELKEAMPDLKIVYVTDLVGHKRDHGWLDLRYYEEMVDSLAQWLSKTHPGLKDVISRNAERVKGEVQVLRSEYEQRLGSYAGKLVIVEYGSMEPLFEQFGISVVAIKRTHEEEASITDLLKISEVVKERDVKVIFVELGSRDPLIDRLSSDLGLRKYEIDLLEHYTLEDFLKGAGYFERMRSNLETIFEAMRLG